MVDVLGDEVHFGQDAIAQTIDQLQVRTQQMFQAEEEMRAEERKSGGSEDGEGNGITGMSIDPLSLRWAKEAMTIVTDHLSE